MRVLIRFRSRSTGGTVSERDRIFEGDAVTLGRATDQVLHLKDKLVALEHARIVKRGTYCVLSCRVVGGATVNEVPVQDARIVPGDVVQIGANILRLLEPPEGFDLAFTFELDPNAARSEAARAPARLRLGGGWLGLRRWSWLLFTAILLLCLLLPASGVLNPAWRTRLRASALPDDHAWLPGPLQVSHANLGKRCEACHDGAFHRVKNDSCLECHGGALHQHADVGGKPVAVLAEQRCGSCHEEHLEPAHLIRRDDGLCADCHARLPEVTGGRQHAQLATDFGTAHPEFSVTMLQFDGGSAAATAVRHSLADAAIREPTALKFPHDKHLVAKGVKGPNGTVVMQCMDCHRPEPGGARMRPISMQEHCESCHRLDFDPANPGREVPHGDAQAVWQVLREYYSARYLAGNPDPRATVQSDRRAGAAAAILSDADRARRLRLAEEQARVVGMDLFERRVCKTCHELMRTVDPELPVAVKPVRLTAQWLPAAHFSHAAHSTAQTHCEKCHEARSSHEAADVLMPRIAVCRECHAGSSSAAADRLASSCTVCHSFHSDRETLWRAARNQP